MNNIYELKPKSAVARLDGLLVEAANVHTIIHRLRAEAAREYPADHSSLPYLFNYFNELESYIDNSTRFFEKLEDETDDISIVGFLSLNEMKRRRNRLNERIALVEERGNITQYSKAKALRGFEPLKGA